MHDIGTCGLWIRQSYWGVHPVIMMLTTTECACLYTDYSPWIECHCISNHFVVADVFMELTLVSLRLNGEQKLQSLPEMNPLLIDDILVYHSVTSWFFPCSAWIWTSHFESRSFSVVEAVFQSRLAASPMVRLRSNRPTVAPADLNIATAVLYEAVDGPRRGSLGDDVSKGQTDITDMNWV